MKVESEYILLRDDPSVPKTADGYFVVLLK